VDPLTGLTGEQQPVTSSTAQDTLLDSTSQSSDTTPMVVTADTSDDESLAASASAITGLSLGDWLNQSIANVWGELSASASTAGFLELLSQVYGSTATDPQAFAAAAQSLAQRLSNGDRLGLRFELETGAEMAGIAGAYAAVGDNGVATIYINGSWLQSASAEQLRLVLLEEIGHAFDTELNGDRDTAGDEGELFAALLTEDTVISDELSSAILADNDAGWLSADGQQIAIEKATPTYIFSESFANNSQGWTLGAEWQIGSATVSSGHVYAGPDPGLDNTSTSDNGVAGVVIGGNASTILHDYYYLTSPTFNTATAIQPKLSYFRWLNSDYTPFMQNAIDIYNGSIWTNIWSSGGAVLESLTQHGPSNLLISPSTKAPSLAFASASTLLLAASTL